MTYLKGYNNEEIAPMLGCSVRSIERRLDLLPKRRQREKD